VVPGVDLWVRQDRRKSRLFPVIVSSDPAYLWGKEQGRSGQALPPSVRKALQREAIVVVPDDEVAERLLQRFQTLDPSTSQETSERPRILVVPPAESPGRPPHWHRRIALPRELLRVATGILVGMLQEESEASSTDAAGDGGPSLDFGRMLQLMEDEFHIDVLRSTGASSPPEALGILYQVALRYGYAPGDAGTQLHTLVLKPDNPLSHIPWFAG
jgi:hypothetical protein